MQQNETAPLCSVTVKQWDSVAIWSWDVQVEMCAICKGAIDDVCIECRGANSGTTLTDKDVEQEELIQGRECFVVWGMCNHVFHLHCISRWVLQQPVCPVCGRVWEVYKSERNEF